VNTPPLALYAHFPWCVQKCPYCDFNSYTLKEQLPEERYIETLRRDLDAQAIALERRPLTSIFLGGGTPSLFSPAAIGRLLEHARARLGFVESIEITLEANPGTIERGRFAEYRAAGVTRVSLGAQSFDARQLARLGRIHSADETRIAAEELHAAGLGNFNLDLMYALPGQTPDDAVNDLRIALALEPAHVSQYHLTIEPGTVFAAAPPTQPAD
jgi:oxygen-independent coproporphyrinogen-3 oxidase